MTFSIIVIVNYNNTVYYYCNIIIIATSRSFFTFFVCFLSRRYLTTCPSHTLASSELLYYFLSFLSHLIPRRLTRNSSLFGRKLLFCLFCFSFTMSQSLCKNHFNSSHHRFLCFSPSLFWGFSLNSRYSFFLWFFASRGHAILRNGNT